MKKLAVILLALTVAACSKSDGDPEIDALKEQWNLVSGQIEQYNDFDPAEIPAVLTEGMLSSTCYFECKGETMSDNVQLWPGGGSIKAIFFEDGTCWKCWTDFAHMYDGGMFYRIMSWRYDASTNTLVTWDQYGESKASVKSLSADAIILDGDLCRSIGVDGTGYRDPDLYLRMVMQRKDAAARDNYIAEARNVEEYQEKH